MPEIRSRFLAPCLALALAACGGSDSKPKAWQPGDPITVDVSGAFPDGTSLRDAYGGAVVGAVAGGKITVTPGAAGLALLEKDGATATPFRWDASTVYFVMTDRFMNGDPSNDGAYGRTKDGAQEIGTWHGGDLAGLTSKLDYLASLGVDAVWITPPVEQVHGWVAGGNGAFQNWAYAGYWALDFTKLDAALGTPAELTAFVDGAHQRGIRVLFDVVMNHPGYGTGKDLLEYLPEVFKNPTTGDPDGGAAYQAWLGSGGVKNWNDFNNYVNYGSSLGWLNWWGKNWIRAGFLQHQSPGPASDPLTSQLAFLPDFLTEKTEVAGVPTLFTRKTDTGVVNIPDATVRDYLVSWHSKWVRDYGIDGFRCDTAKHVEKPAWKALKDASTAALAAWKAANPSKKLDDLPFWTTGEVYPHGVLKDDYYTAAGFDSLLNFDLQPFVQDQLTGKAEAVEFADEVEARYSAWSVALADPAFDVLSYVSSHDTKVMLTALEGSAAKQRQALTLLLLVPGAAQLFYGDESGRAATTVAADPTAGTRSDMNWSTTDAVTLEHTRKLGTFRKKHGAVGAGAHTRLTSPAGTYAFSRTLDQGGVKDAVVVVLAKTP